MDSKQIKHDLTLLIISDTVKEKTPESVVKAYNEIFAEVEKAFNECNKDSRKARVVNRRDLGL